MIAGISIQFEFMPPEKPVNRQKRFELEEAMRHIEARKKKNATTNK